MKLIKIIGHPVLVMSMFLLILISGQQFGGFYLFYIVMGLPFGAPHAIIALVGLVSMFIGYKIARQQVHVLKPLLFLLGDVLCVLALVMFFGGSKGYNDSTFEQIVPLISFGLYGLCLLGNIFYSLSLILHLPRNNNKPLKVTS